jgi:hypothetical protein
MFSSGATPAIHGTRSQQIFKQVAYQPANEPTDGVIDKCSASIATSEVETNEIGIAAVTEHLRGCCFDATEQGGD